MASTNVNSGDSLAAFLTPSIPHDHDSELISTRLDGAFNNSPFEVTSGNHYDINTLKSENRILKSKIKQIQSDLVGEQDNVAAIRKKLNTSERERLDAMAKVNEEISQLDSEVTKLRAQQEKGEAVRQDLELQLTKSKRDVSNEKRNVSEREALINEINESMKQRIDELTGQIDGLCNELENSKLNSNEDLRKLRQQIEEKEKENKKLQVEEDALENEKAKLENSLGQNNNLITELEARMKELDDDKRKQGDELRRQITELDMIREQYNILKKEYESASTRVKSLEDGIEAERAAHLESKFNSEIVQLRLRDMENALDIEKNTKMEALSSTEKLNRQLREIQNIYDEERKLSLETKEKLEKAEKEYADLSKQLSQELEDKKLVIKNLSCQLEEHQKDFNELRNELTKAKRKQISLEETYSGSMKELDLLYDTFKLENAGKKVAAKKTSEKKSVKSLHPSTVMENLRHTLITYSKKLVETDSELVKVKEQKDVLDKESKKCKDQLTSKEKTLQSTKSDIISVSKRLEAIELEKHDQEKLIKQLRDDLDIVHRQLQKEKGQNGDLAEQCSVVIRETKSSKKNVNEFMYHLYHQLCIDLPSAEKVDINKRSFEDSSVLITEYASKLVNNCRWMNEKIRHLETTICNKDELVKQMQKAHEEQLEKMTSIAEGRSQQWVQQKAEMEHHYSQLLGEIHNRHKKTQSLADQAWEKVRMTGSVQQGLEQECDNLRKELLQLQDERDCLLAACSLLCGAVYPLYLQNQSLGKQRGILMEQLDRFGHFKSEVQKLVDALSMDNRANNRQKQDKAKSVLKSREQIPLLKFRASAVAVIAANRLINASNKGQCKMFCADHLFPGLESSIVCFGGMEEPPQRRFIGAADPDRLGKIEPDKTKQTVEWLSSPNLLTIVTATMGDLVCAMNQSQRGDKGYDREKVVSAAKKAYQKLVCHLPATFPTIDIDPHSGLRERNSLIKQLGFGLNRVLAEGSLDENVTLSVESSHNTLSCLQKHLLEFTQRLHKAEVERRDLRQEVDRLEQQMQNFDGINVDGERMAKELNFLRQQVKNTVERDRFEQICSELNKALQREQEAQQLLNEQSQQLHDLGLKLESQVGAASEKDHTITEAVKGLSETKMESKRQEQRVRQLTRQIEQLEESKTRFSENVKDAENALRTAAKDKEALSAYMKTIEKILNQVTNTILRNSNDASSTNKYSHELSRLLSSELVPASINKISSELAGSQSLVAAFTDALKQLCGRMTTVYAEMDQYKQHIARLKQELSAACRREYENDEFEKIKNKGPLSIEEPFSPSRTFIGNGKSFLGNRNFVPLEEDLDDTYGLPASTMPNSRSAGSKGITRSSYPEAAVPNISSSHKRKPTEGGERR